MKLRLDQLPLRQPMHIDRIDWESLGAAAARRLRELGFEEGVAIEALHSGGWIARDPIACRVGRMTVAIRRAHAAAISVAALPAE